MFGSIGPLVSNEIWYFHYIGFACCTYQVLTRVEYLGYHLYSGYSNVYFTNCEGFYYFFTDRYIVRGVFWYLHSLYSLKAGAKYFVTRSIIGFHIL